MAAWKQILFAAVILVAAAAAWVRFFPGAPEILARWGIEWASASTPAAGSAPQQHAAAADLRATVVAAPVTSATINDRLQAIGTGRAAATVAVNPYAAGRLVAFEVASGARIQAGQVIARLDSETEEIALERAKAQRDDARAKVERIRALRSSNTATAVQLTDAELELRNAELSVHDAQVTFDRRSVTSPISGIVGILPIALGSGAGGEARNAYERRDVKTAIEESNRETLVIVQVESLAAVEIIDEIASVPGLDVVLIGPQDLSISMGLHGQFTHPDFVATLQTVTDACKKHGVATGMVEREAAAQQRWYEMGMQFLCTSTDGYMLLQSATRDVETIRGFVAG